MKGEKKRNDIIIVGAGLAGLGCAKRLHDAGIPFTIITENIGGRVKTSPDGEVNYGAYYITKDCTQVRPYLDIIRKLKPSVFHFHRGEQHYHFWSPRLFLYAPSFAKLIWDLFWFRKHFNAMRKKSVDCSRKDLIEADPLLRNYYHQCAGEYIRERGIEDIVRRYLEHVLWGSFFVDPHTVPTFIFLQCLLPLIVPTYSFKMNFDLLIEKCKGEILFDSVISVTKKEDVWILKLKSGESFECQKLILATPMTTTNQLVDPQGIKKTIEVSYIHGRGVLREPYRDGNYHFFSVEERTALAKEDDGTFLYFYTGEQKVSKYFSSFSPIVSSSWKPALLICGDEYTDENPESNLFLANDHNVASTEDAFINGMYTASLIINGMEKESSTP